MQHLWTQLTATSPGLENSGADFMAKRRIMDVSVALKEGMPIYEGNPPFQVSWAMSRANGDAVNLTELREGVHTGTHVDAPYHFIDGGMKIDRLPLEDFFVNVHLIECRGKTVGAEVLRGRRVRAGEGVLFKTRNSSLYGRPFTREFVYLEGSLAEKLVEKGVSVVGIDYLSVEAFGSHDAPVHNTLLSHNIPIIEGLCFRGVKPGRYTLAAFPLRLEGREAAPTRAVLFSPPFSQPL